MKVTITPIQPFPVEGKGSDPLLLWGGHRKGEQTATLFQKKLQRN